MLKMTVDYKLQICTKSQFLLMLILADLAKA